MINIGSGACRAPRQARIHQPLDPHFFGWRTFRDDQGHLHPGLQQPTGLQRVDLDVARRGEGSSDQPSHQPPRNGVEGSGAYGRLRDRELRWPHVATMLRALDKFFYDAAVLLLGTPRALEGD